jgi:hypothetical protein
VLRVSDLVMPREQAIISSSDAMIKTSLLAEIRISIFSGTSRGFSQNIRPTPFAPYDKESADSTLQLESAPEVIQGMEIQRTYSLRAAAKALGVSRDTLRRWLQIDLGLRFPNIVRGSRHLITQAQIDAVLRKRAARTHEAPGRHTYV